MNKQAISPLVSVVMAVYNGEKYLEAAINSILKQTLTDFEYIVINDGSRDRTASILERYQATDARLCVYHQENRGLTAALNRGLRLAKGKYIARMDADDISLPKRFAKQVAFLKAHPEVGVCGTWVRTIGQYAGQVEKYPTNDTTIRAWLLFNSALIHPSVMMRREHFVKANLYYNPSHLHCEDYGLWVEAAKHFALSNLGEVLLLYRYHSQQVTQQNYLEQAILSQPIWLAQLEHLGLQPTEDEREIHQSFRTLVFPVSQNLIEQAHRWLNKIQRENEHIAIYEKVALANVLGYRWFLFCSAATELGWWIWQRFWQSPLSKATNLSWQDKLKFAVKCGMRRRSQF